MGGGLNLLHTNCSTKSCKIWCTWCTAKRNQFFKDKQIYDEMIFTGTTVNEDVQPSTNTIIRVLEDMKVVTKYKQQDLFKKKKLLELHKKARFFTKMFC